VTIPPLLDHCVDALRHMYDEDSGLFSFSTRIVDGSYANSFEGPSVHRYSINTLAGLQRAVQHYGIDWDFGEALERLLARQRNRIDNVGDRGLLLHVLASSDHDDQDALFRELAQTVADERIHRLLNLQELCWVVLGLVTYAEQRQSDRARALAGRLLDVVAEHYGDPRAPLPDFTASRWRRGFVSFGGISYYLMALSRYGSAFDDAPVLARFRAGTAVVTGLQGPCGEWPWFIDARRGRILDWYQVYSVHQDSMSMLFVLPALDMGLPGMRETTERSFRWIFGANELGISMVSEDPFLIWRSIRRRERQERARRYLRSALSVGLARRPQPGQLEINRECRSYELGWILFAWSGRTDMPKGGEIADLSRTAQGDRRASPDSASTPADGL
jgi:hypothetical protein